MRELAKVDPLEAVGDKQRRLIELLAEGVPEETAKVQAGYSASTANN
jgi:hypothetical protein